MTFPKKNSFLAALFLSPLLLFPRPVLCDSPSGDDPNRFLGVKRWTGSVQVEYMQREEYLQDCGTDTDEHGKFMEYGKAWDSDVLTGRMNLNLDLPYNELKPTDDQGKEDEKADAQEKKLEAMAQKLTALTGQSMESAGADASNEEIRLFGDNNGGQFVGEGSIQWERNGNWACPNGSRRIRASGSGPAKDISALLYVTVGKDWQDYSLSVNSFDIIPGDSQTTDKWRHFDVYCRGGAPDKICEYNDWHKTPYWTKAVDQVTRNGAHTYDYRSSSTRESKENRVQHETDSNGVPETGPGMGSVSAGLSVVDISGDKVSEPFGPPPQYPENAGTDQKSIDAAMEKYNAEMKVWRAKVWPALPKSGNVLQGETTWSEKEDGNDPPHKFARTMKIRWNLAPYGKSEYEVEVEIEGYKDWRPKGNKDAKKRGNTLTVHAKLIDPKTGKAPDAKAEKFIFELKETSKVKGVAMNWPSERVAAEDDDMKFEYEENPEKDFVIENDGQTISTREKKWFDGATVNVSSFDWGGYAGLYVKAVMPGGDTAEGHLKGETGRQIIPLPKRTGDSKIADGWKENTPGASGKADDADDETKPENRMATCANHHGDGLTLYDEYRGFYSRRDFQADEGHISGDPRLKDYFVIDSTGEAQLAIKRFENASGLKVHSWLMLDEVKDYKNPVVNFNKGGVKNDVEQHAVELIRSSFSQFDSEATSRSGFQRPGTPGTLPVVNLGIRLSFTDMMRTIPHELGHASTIAHHGSSDEGFVYWTEDKRDGQDVIVEVHADNWTDALFDAHTKGEVIEATAEPDGFPMEPSRFRKPRRLWVARKHGQHSGDESCVMRYTLADAYDPSETGSNKRIFKEITAPPEKSGYTYCQLPDGTGDAGRRYGSADTQLERGACKYQICVNDKYMYGHQGRK
ncbi:MAG TPA: hypothetical protein VL688_02695 [Verrucomicrobiae bacterium]|nr:hypothetical protein [Verrucomicrobiae bacterium]